MLGICFLNSLKNESIDNENQQELEQAPKMYDNCLE